MNRKLQSRGGNVSGDKGLCFIVFLFVRDMHSLFIEFTEGRVGQNHVVGEEVNHVRGQSQSSGMYVLEKSCN